MDPPHNYTNTNILQDHHKLSSQLIFQDTLPFVGKDLSLKVSFIISHIVTQLKYTPSYKKSWITKNETFEQVYENWETLYNELPQYMVVLHKYVPEMISVMEMLSAYIKDEACVNRTRIIH